jgi:hypothetical protein
MQFHIHINGITVDAEIASELVDAGFTERPFLNNRPFQSQFTPRIHLSAHSDNALSFKKLFRTAKAILEQSPSIVAYMEGEYVLRQMNLNSSESLLSTKSNCNIPFSFRLAPAMSWRQSEVHLTLNRERTSKQIHEQLLELGLYWTDIQKDDGVSTIYTAQGSKELIGQVYNHLKEYLTASHYSVVGKIKEERSLGYWISDDYTWIPPQIIELLPIATSKLK